MNIDNINRNTLQYIFKFSIPSIIAMLLTSLVTIVDGLFIGNYVGKDGLASINLGLPILYVYLAIAVMSGAGGVSIAGRFLGSKDYKRSNNIFNQTVTTTFIIIVLISLILLVTLTPILSICNLSEEVHLYMLSYYNIMILVYPFMMLNIVFGMFIRGEGKPEIFMIVSIITNIINVTLDYIFVSRLLLGIKGAAWASLISVSTGFILMIIYFMKISKFFQFHSFVFSKNELFKTLANGSSELIGQLSMSITVFAFNGVILREIGIVGVTAFSIVSYSAYIFNMIIIGFGQGSSPMISFSFGAGNIDLCNKIRKLTNYIVLITGLAMLLIMNLSSTWYSGIFVKDLEVKKLVSDGIKIFTIAFLFSGINVISSFYFTSLGKAKESALISASRGLVVLLICIFLLPKLFGITGIWLVVPVTEFITLVLSLFLLKIYVPAT